MSTVALWSKLLGIEHTPEVLVGVQWAICEELTLGACVSWFAACLSRCVLDRKVVASLRGIVVFI